MIYSAGAALLLIAGQAQLHFAGAEYINFLSSVTPDNQDEYMAQMRRFNLGIIGEADCPVFDGLFEYCQV